MKFNQTSRFAAFCLALLLGTTASAAPPATSPYVTDVQNIYVQDATSDAVGSVNMVLCIINGMNINGSGMLNVGPYIALVDVNKCQSHQSSGSSGASGAGDATNYMTAIVDATRATSSDPMVAKVWMSLTQNGGIVNIYIKLTATQSPADVPPYGVFRLDYIGMSNSAVQFNGFIDSASGNFQYYETGQGSSNTALSMTAGSTTSGSGTITTVSPAVTFNFNYNPNYFRRSDGTNDECFDRLKANAQSSVWQYGTYNSTDGTRVDQANPSFQVLATYGGNSYYGNVGYFGFNFQGLDLNSIPDASPIPALVVADQRVGNSSTYNLSKVSGLLTQWTQNATTLAAMDGIPFYFNADLTGLTTGGNPAVTGMNNWQMQWNNAAGNFTVTGTQSCGGNGCITSSLTAPATVNSGALDGIAISGYSDSFGGNINIPSSSVDHVSADAVYFFSQQIVVPGSALEPTTLYCLSNCPTAASIAAANAYTSGNAPSPFDATSASQWFSSPSAADTISYTFGSAGLINASAPMIITNAAFYNNSSMFQNGIMSGRLFTTPFASCMSGSTVCEPSAPAVYYTWSTGPNQWNQSMWLTKTSDSSIVTFDAPLNIAYTVPAGTNYGTWAGKNIQLQFNGFGNLNGIPGYCVNPVNNSAVDCSAPNSQYVPAFSIPDGASLTSGSTTMLVKALDEELRLQDLGANAAQCSAMSLTPMTPPTGGTHDPSSSTDPYYIGVQPTVTSSPLVIDGIVQ